VRRSCEVWWTRADGGDRSILSTDEQAQLDRIAVASRRREYLAAHALVRTTLSRYADVEPAAWTFRENAWGRPEVVGHALRFSLSHTDGLVAVAVTHDRDVGIDVEALDRRPATPELADHFFAPVEAAAVRAQPERFLEYWTLKEAYVKARGMGMAIPLDQFWFDGPELALTAVDAERWRFERFRPTANHALAVCVERDVDAIVLREVA
jgi:4'-phosphopantetheinyl transferase